MKKLLHLISVIIIAALLSAACRRNLDPTLHRAEALMDSHPDSALALLRTDSIRLAHDPLFALLYTQASMKNRIIPPNDSLIAIAANHFTDINDSNYMKAQFYLGTVRYYNHQYTSAITPALFAYEFSTKGNDDYWRAKCAELIADIYSHTYFNAIPFRNEAIEYYLKAGKIPNHRYAICDLASSLTDSGEALRAAALLDSIAIVAQKDSPVDSGLLYYCYEYLLPTYNKMHETQKADSVYRALLNLGKYYQPDFLGFCYVAELQLDKGELDSAFEIYSELRPIAKTGLEKVYVYYGLSEYYTKQKRNDLAKYYTDSLLYVQGREVSRVLDQSSVIAIQRDHFKQLAVLEHSKSNRLTIIIILIAVIFIIATIAIVVTYHERSKNKKLIIDQQLDEIMQLTGTIEQQERFLTQESLKNSELSSHIISLLKDRWNNINKLCNDYYRENMVDNMPKENNLVDDKN